MQLFISVVILALSLIVSKIVAKSRTDEING